MFVSYMSGDVRGALLRATDVTVDGILDSGSGVSVFIKHARS